MIIIYRYLLFGTITLGILIFSIAPVCGEEISNITIHQIGNHHASDPFNISGTTTLFDCDQIGVEIFPKQYWDQAWTYAHSRNAKGFRFLLPSVIPELHSIATSEISTGDFSVYYGVFFTVFNQDGTCTLNPAPVCPDHRIQFSPVTTSSDGVKHWGCTFNKNPNENRMTSDLYQVLVWDATNQLVYEDVNIANLYDVQEKKIYPTTSDGTIWDPHNHKELSTTTFSLS